jgi:hypothetical protein
LPEIVGRRIKRVVCLVLPVFFFFSDVKILFPGERSHVTRMDCRYSCFWHSEKSDDLGECLVVPESFLLDGVDM